MSRSIAIVGCGGINSWFVQHLNDILKIFDKRDLSYVKLFDNDEVEEKNLKRGNQNFQVEDLMEQKVVVLGKKYNFDYEVTFITEENINELFSPFDDIILGVDNNKTRKLVYKYCMEKKKYLLDMRAQGTQMMFIILEHKRGMEYYENTYFNNAEVMERKGSCQLERDVQTDHIENANKAIAYLGAYCLYFKHLRGEDVAIKEFKIAY